MRSVLGLNTLLVVMTMRSFGPAVAKDDHDSPSSTQDLCADAAADASAFFANFAEMTPTSRSDGGASLGAYGDAKSAESSYQNTLAQARMQDAEAQYQEAQTDALRTLINAQKDQLARLALEQAVVDNEIRIIKAHAAVVDQLNVGDISEDTFPSLRFFMTSVVGTVTVRDTMRTQVGPLAAQDFIDRNGGSQALAFAGGNSGQLLLFLEKNRLGLTPWSDAHFHVLDILAAFAAPAAAKLKAYQILIQCIQDRKTDIWKLPSGGGGSRGGGGNSGGGGGINNGGGTGPTKQP